MLDRESRLRRLKPLYRGNPLGLRFEFELEGDTARTGLILNENHQDSMGYIHDGVIAFLMDVAMGWIARHGAGVNSVTAKLEIEYYGRVKAGEPIVITSHIAKRGSRLVEETGSIELEDGTLIARANCLQYVMSPSDSPH